MQWLLSMLVTTLLNWLRAWATQAVSEHMARVEKDKQQGITNEKNIKEYEAAADRAARIRAAERLLNRT